MIDRTVAVRPPVGSIMEFYGPMGPLVKPLVSHFMFLGYMPSANIEPVVTF